MLRTPLTLGLLSFVAGAAEVQVDIPEAGNPGLQLQTALQVGFVHRAGDGKFSFFHPSFAECYATVHCWRYLGDQSPDGWDDARSTVLAFSATAASFRNWPRWPPGEFWRGELADQIAFALNAIGDPDIPQVVETLLRLAGYDGLGVHGLIPVGDFAKRCSDEMKTRFVDQLSSRTLDSETVHQLLGLGELGLEAVVAAYNRLDREAPMRGQIESYLIVRKRLKLPR